MNRARLAGAALAIAGLGGLLGAPAATAGTTSASTVPPTLVGITAAHHPGFDRIVFTFTGALPAQRSARYVSQLLAQGSGKVVPVVGNARMLVRFFAATGHNSANHVTYGPIRRTYALPNIIQVVNTGDFESVLTFGLGLARMEPFHLFTMTNPSRVVIDVTTPYQTVPVRDFLLDSHRFATGTPPLTRAVIRPVIAPSVAFGALQRLFAGPTPAEWAAGLHFVASKATGFADLTIRDHVARVRLTGGCGSGGSTFTIADEITPTLKQFASVKWVKIYDPAGHTERSAGHVDSIPVCLEP